MKKIKIFINRIKALSVRWELVMYILFSSKHERFGQYLSNRIDFEKDDIFYWEDEYVLHHLQKKDREMEWK